jgi:hypothetical protein
MVVSRRLHVQQLIMTYSSWVSKVIAQLLASGIFDIANVLAECTCESVAR